MSVLELNNFRPNVELNNVKSQHEYTEKSPIIEIFSAMINGKDTSKYGEKANKAYSYIKKLAENAELGDSKAKVELNTITAIMIQAPLLKRLQLFNYMGNVTNVGYDERLLYKVYKLQGTMSNWQASQGDVNFPISTWDYREMTTQTISGGTATNYRQIQTGNLDGTSVMVEQVQTDMINKVFYKVINDLYNGIKGATGVKHFSEAAGITKSALDDTIKKIRRWGSVGIFGDYSVASQINDFTGFKTDTAGTLAKQLPIATVDQIMQTGLIHTYNGTPVTEIPNSYNLTKLTNDGSDFVSYLPEGLLFVTPSGEMSPLQVGFRGGLTSKSGFDVVTGYEMTRFDLEVGDVLIPEYVPMVGLISDSNYPVVK